MNSRTRIDRLGEKQLNNQGLLMEIIRYGNKKDIDVKFENGFVSTGKEYSKFKTGQIKNAYFPAVCEIGYIGVGELGSSSHPKIYRRWGNMIERCYSRYLHKKHPYYAPCSVDDRWHCFQNFGKWYEENFKDWMNETWALDKDIIVKGNKVYSPETCCFVPQEINSLFPKCDRARGKYPIGVCLQKKGGAYQSSCRIGTKQHYIGYYITPDDAFMAYKEFKENHIKEVAEKWKNLIDERVYQALINYKVEITD